MMNKTVISMEPMKYVNNSNFKLAPYKAWVQAGGKVTKSHFAWRKAKPLLNILSYILPKSQCKAMLCFVEPSTLDIDTFPWSGCREIIPIIWDCWPKCWKFTEQWFKRHRVQSAIFTSSQTADEFRSRFPRMSILTITEGIEANLFHGEKPLKERDIDLLQFGRVANRWGHLNFGEEINTVCSRNERDFLHTRENLVEALADSKIVLCLPRCDTQPEIAEGIETLTQRYWECMLSGVVLLGRAPQELINLLGYNPVVPLDEECIIEQVSDIVEHISDYQDLVDKNKTSAKEKADWSLRIQIIRNWLRKEGYRL